MLDISKTEDKRLFDGLVNFVEKHHGGNTWAAVLDNGKERYLHLAVNRPCYGEIRSYGIGSTRPNDKKPSDLPKPLPVGELREAIAVVLPFVDKTYDPLISFMLSEESPWRAGLPKDLNQHLTIIKSNQEAINGFVLTDTEFEATTFLNLIRSYRNFTVVAQHFNEFVKDTSDLKVALIKAIVRSGPASHEYCFSSLGSVEQFYNGKSRNLGVKSTFREGDDYNRPSLGLVFTPDSLPESSVDSWGSVKITDVPYLAFRHLNLAKVDSSLAALGIPHNGDK